MNWSALLEKMATDNIRAKNHNHQQQGGQWRQKDAMLKLKTLFWNTDIIIYFPVIDYYLFICWLESQCWKQLLFEAPKKKCATKIVTSPNKHMLSLPTWWDSMWIQKPKLYVYNFVGLSDHLKLYQDEPKNYVPKFSCHVLLRSGSSLSAKGKDKNIKIIFHNNTIFLQDFGLFLSFSIFFHDWKTTLDVVRFSRMH